MYGDVRGKEETKKSLPRAQMMTVVFITGTGNLWVLSWVLSQVRVRVQQSRPMTCS